MFVWKKSQKGNEVQAWVAETKAEARSGLGDELTDRQRLGQCGVEGGSHRFLR